jgi:hypothetical protein
VGSVKRAKYQEESAKVSSVSVSRCAGPPQAGTGRGLPVQIGIQRIAPHREIDFLRQQHRQLASGTGTTPQAAQCTMGMGQPQGRWRDTSQSRRR